MISKDLQNSTRIPGQIISPCQSAVDQRALLASGVTREGNSEVQNATQTSLQMKNDHTGQVGSLSSVVGSPDDVHSTRAADKNEQHPTLSPKDHISSPDLVQGTLLSPHMVEIGQNISQASSQVMQIPKSGKISYSSVVKSRSVNLCSMTPIVEAITELCIEDSDIQQHEVNQVSSLITDIPEVVSPEASLEALKTPNRFEIFNEFSDNAGADLDRDYNSDVDNDKVPIPSPFHQDDISLHEGKRKKQKKRFQKGPSGWYKTRSKASAPSLPQ